MIGEAVLVPGTLCDARVFAPLLTLLPEVDGRVFELGAHESIEAAAQAALEAAPPRFTVIGFSLGGFVALEMLRRAPDRLRGVALIAGNAHPDAPENAEARRADVARARHFGLTAFVAEHWPRWSAASLPAVVTDMAIGLGHAAYARHAEMNITRPDLRGVALDSPVPILIVAGTEDRLCSRERYEAAAAGPNARLELVPGAGHYIPLEAPAAVAAAITAWEVAA